MAINWETKDPFARDSPETAVLEYLHRWKQAIDRESNGEPLTFPEIALQIAYRVGKAKLRRLEVAFQRLSKGGNLRKAGRRGNQILWEFRVWGGYGACTCDGCRGEA